MSPHDEVARLLWRSDGSRRLVSAPTFDRAVSRFRLGGLEQLCELDPRGPLYFIPTRPWVRALANYMRALGVRRILEIGAGDGFVSQCLRVAAPDLQITASDSGKWERPESRMNTEDRRRLAGKPVPGVRLGSEVLRLEARVAIRKRRPQLVIVCWPPPGPLLDRLIRSPVRYVLDIGAAGGVTSSQWSWRFNHEILSGPLETLARCRLDERPGKELHTRVTLYYGGSHPEHRVERVQRGDWLWQFRPRQA